MAARLQNGLRVQGGVSTGKTTEDNCELRAQILEISVTNPFCHTETKFLTQIKALGTYVIPRADIQLAATVKISAQFDF